MQIAYLTLTLVIGVFLTYIWSSRNWLNATIRVALTLWTIWTLIMLIGTLTPMIQSGNIRLV